MFVHVQRQYLPPKWVNSAVMTRQWRLIDGKELYDIKADPGQESDIAAGHPEVVENLRAEYERWWKSLTTCMWNCSIPNRRVDGRLPVGIGTGEIRIGDRLCGSVAA